MIRFLYEITESVRIALAQIRANKMRSALTALGVIIGILAVTLMGTAINGIDKGFQDSLAMLGEDVLYVQKWPWGNVEDWWNYMNRPRIRPEQADELNRIIQNTPNSLLEIAMPSLGRQCTVKKGENKIDGVYTSGVTADLDRFSSVDYDEGRLFTETEANAGRQVCVLGYDVAKALFPLQSALGQSVLIGGQPFTVVGVMVKQGSFLGIFSMDNQAIIPLACFRRFFGTNRDPEIRVKIVDKTRLADAREELTGAMRRVRGQLPGERDNFTVNEQQAFKAQLDPIKFGIFAAGLVIASLSLFVGAIGIMNITFVSVKERTKEIGTRKALGARQRTILLQFLIEAVSICLVGGVIGVLCSVGICETIRAVKPTFPVVLSSLFMTAGIAASIVTGVLSGFVPAWMASRLDPVEALRYE